MLNESGLLIDDPVRASYLCPLEFFIGDDGAGEEEVLDWEVSPNAPREQLAADALAAAGPSGYYGATDSP